MEIWRRNLYVLCGSLFVVMVAMSMIMPFLPLYIQQDFGIDDPHQVTAWAGIIFGANFLTAGLVSPIWGNLADKHGRKIMILRSGYFMSITVALTGFAGSLWQLLALRLINGLVGGIIPASTALVASSVPKERIGWAQGLLQSFITAGTIMGPLFGGVLANQIGFRMIFLITGSLLLLATLVITFTVKESFVPPEKKDRSSLKEDFQMIFSSKELPALFFVTVMIQFALFSIVPVLPIYISQLVQSEGAKVALWAGIVQAAMGIANVFASPQLGRLGDRFGSQKVLLFALLGAAILFIPQGLVWTVWQLVVLRFLLGLSLGGLLPSVNALLRRATPSHMVSRVYGYNNSFVSIGSMLGPMIGGFMAGYVSINGVFFMTSAFLFINAGWVYYSFFRNKTVQSTDSGID
ncbi:MULTISPECIES: MFS transporter [Brevibacillus]|jgi:Arabinose efflux permease|uniref:MFS transporter n=1 Tax=Brevibacillus parabrevis TaxID=54914 RepID=A0A4Y3PVV0_BREPA|nr:MULTISPECIES: MFS transporter [Brevibacillus]MBU8716322.1 MFS transporter [Brevibacillus parabrevis]MDH6352299.1 DHA1 family multidrug resistance protein-like MFS transporter [Brevibacillus sp. 1238]MDR5000091.1 MFS transporter [Brevibacillus parabrevis]MED2255260.1 MFS transporter [Brevibacillus parabrevis]NRQ54789.1 MFS transporter [Brevibacillus sp. HD1.4A]